jgi:hypothetical protein
MKLPDRVGQLWMWESQGKDERTMILIIRSRGSNTHECYSLNSSESWVGWIDEDNLKRFETRNGMLQRIA